MMIGKPLLRQHGPLPNPSPVGTGEGQECACPAPGEGQECFLTPFLPFRRGRGLGGGSHIAFFLLALLTPASAQTPPDTAGQTQVGPVSVTWHKGFSYAGNSLTLTGDVQLSSATFGLTGQTVTLDFAPTQGKQATPGASGLRRATAVGGANSPVTGHFEQTALARSFTVRAEKMVFTPSPAAVKGETGTIELTGGVVLTMRDPAALDGPAVSKSEHMTVRVGPGPEYPQIIGSAGTFTFTPLQ